MLLALIMSYFPLTPTAFAATKSPAQVAEDCADPRPTQAGDIIYWDPECYLTFKSSKQVWGEATMPDKLGSGKSPIAYGCTSSGSVSVAGTKSSSTSFSFGLDIGGKKKFGDWEASVGPKLGWSWTWSTSDTHTHTAAVPLGSVGWIEVKEPLIEAVVDIDARYDGNKNELVKNAVVRVPDTSRSFAWLYQSRKMTDTELRDICGQDPPTTKTYDMWSARRQGSLQEPAERQVPGHRPHRPQRRARGAAYLRRRGRAEMERRQGEQRLFHHPQQQRLLPHSPLQQRHPARPEHPAHVVGLRDPLGLGQPALVGQPDQDQRYLHLHQPVDGALSRAALQ